MPIRRVPAPPAPEKDKASAAAAASATAEKEPEATAPEETSPPADEAPAASSAAAAEGEEVEATVEPEPTENGEKAEEGPAEKTAEEAEKKDDKCKDCAAGQCTTHCYVLLPRLKDGYKYEKAKVKKIKKTIPAWASISSNKNIPVAKYSGMWYNLDCIIFEAIKANDKAAVTYRSVMNYLTKKYPRHDLDRKRFFIKKAIKKHLEKGNLRQLKGKGLSGSFVMGRQPPNKMGMKPTAKMENLADALPLIITRLCEPKEASFFLIKKYLEQHFPSLNVENRPEVLKTALGRAVEKGHLDQITGKGARGTFQLKRTGNQVLLKGGPMEDAILAAITAMNEPKTCSITTLRKHLLDVNKDIKEYLLVASLKRTLTKCKVLGWMEQITGHGFSGTYQLSFPYYPSPSVLYPDKFDESLKKKEEPVKRKRIVESSDEEESEEDEDEEEEPAPSRRRKGQKRPLLSRPVSGQKERGKAKSPAKKVASSAIKSASKARKPAASKKGTPKATPVKRAAPAKKPKTPAVKKMTKRGSKRPAAKRSSPEAPAAEKEAPKSRSKQPQSAVEPAPKRGSKRSKTGESSPKQPAAKQPAAKKQANSSKQSTRKSKRGKN